MELNAAKLLYFVRHGQTEYNKMKIVQGSGVDIGLNSTGHKQANKFFEAYKDTEFDLIVSSKLTRAIETVHPFIHLGIPHIQLEELNEISWGVHEGKVSTKEMIDAYNKMIASWAAGHLDASLDGGESANELIARVSQGLSFIKKRKEQKILICTHGRTLRCLMTLIAEEKPVEMEKYRHLNTGLFLVKQTGDALDVLSYNDVTHLEK